MTILPSTPPPSSGGSGCLGYLGIGVAILVLVGGCSALMNGSKDDSLEYGAWDVCQQEVSSYLKSPATAGFPLMSEFTVTRSGDSYSMRAWVDAENGFGANVRTYFHCTATHTSGDRFTVKVSFN